MPCCNKNRGDRRKPGFGEGLWWSEEVLAVGHGGGGGGGGCGGGGGRHGSPGKPQDVPEPAVDESKPTTSTEETDSVPEPTEPVVVDIPDKQPTKPSALGYNTFDNRDSDNDRLVLIPFERKKKCFCRCSLTFLVMVSGFLFGYDTGVVSGSMLLIQPYFHLSMLWAQVIVSATVGTAALTSSVAEFVADFVGRKVVIGTAAVLFTTGAIVMSEAETVMVIIVGRIIVGFSMGFSTVVVVLYVKESALASRLKWLLGWLQLMYTIGNMVANFLTMVLHYLGDNTVWQYLLGFGAIPSILQFIAIMLLPESPRWLMECDDEEGARESLILLRGTDQVEDELEVIRLDVEEERNELDKDDSDDTWDILGDIIDEVEDELLSDSDEDGTNPNSSKDKQKNGLNKDCDLQQQDSNKGPTEKENGKGKGNAGDDLLDKTKSGGKGQDESKEKDSNDAVQNKQGGGSQDGSSSKHTPQNSTDSSSTDKPTEGGNKKSNSGSGNGSQSAISDSAPSDHISGMNRNEQGSGNNSEQSGKSGSNPQKGGVDSTKDKNASSNPHSGDNGDGSPNGNSGQSVGSSSSADNVSKQDPSATDNESSGNASHSHGNDNQGGNSSSGGKNNSGGNKNTTGGDNNSDGNSNLGGNNNPDGNSNPGGNNNSGGNSNPGGNNNSGGNNNADSSKQNSGKSANSPNKSGNSNSTDGKASQSGNGANSNSGNGNASERSGGNGTKDSENNTNKDGGNQSTSGSPDENSSKGSSSQGNEGNDQNVNATGSSGSGKLGGKDSEQNSEKKSKKSKQKKKQKKVVNRKDYEKLEGGVVPKGSMSSKPPIIRIMLKPKVRQSAMNVSFLHLFQQLSGISCIILYGGSMILLSGLPTNLSLGLLNIPNTLYVVATYLSNKFEPMKDDRRQLLLSSFIGVFFGMALIATGYQLLELYPRPVSVFENTSLVGLPLEDLYFGYCNHTYFQTCGMCIYTEFCGFCYTNWWDGSCLPTDLNNSLKSYVGRCNQSHTSNSHYKFIHNDCPNDFGWFVVVGMVVFVLAYAPGLGQITQRENSQRCPVWARKTSNSIARSINWGANLLISMTFLLLMVAMTKYGTCWMFTALCLVGVIYTAILLPDE